MLLDYNFTEYDAAGRQQICSELAEIAQQAGVPFIVSKRYYDGESSVKKRTQRKAGAQAIIVSNTSGPCLDQCAATAEILPEIAAAVGGKMRIIVDGGVRW